MISLLDALAAHTDSVSLKDLSAQHRPASVDRAPHPKRHGDRALRRPRRTRRLPARHASARAGQSRQGAAERARRRASGPMRELHRATGQTVNLSIRQGDEIVYIERAFSERSGMQVVRAIGGRAPLHLTSVRQAVPGRRRSEVRARLRDPHRAGGPHAQQHHRSAEAGARTVAGARARLRARQRGTRTWRALHRGRDTRRRRQARRRACRSPHLPSSCRTTGSTSSARRPRGSLQRWDTSRPTSRRTRTGSAARAAWRTAEAGAPDDRRTSRPSGELRRGRRTAAAPRCEPRYEPSAACVASVVRSGAGLGSLSSQWRIRWASPKRDRRPIASRSTITIGLPSTLTCMTRQLPASEM